MCSIRHSIGYRMLIVGVMLKVCVLKGVCERCKDVSLN